jgi:hypothetical protein
VEARGYRPSDAYFHLVPGQARALVLTPLPGAPPLRGRVRALNAAASVPIRSSPLEPVEVS